MEEKKLTLIIQPKVIDNLGINMYQNPVDVISEIIANSWDADAETVEIIIDNTSHKISIKDFGVGMSFEDCQNCYLNVGRDRRQVLATDITNEKKRHVLGRKGIGKFAGFGIANTITITTISKETKEKTVFRMVLEEILKYDLKNELNKPIELVEYNAKSIEPHGTLVELTLNNSIEIDIDEFIIELSKRFLLQQLVDDFSINVNGAKLPDNFSDEMEFVFPRDLTADEIAGFSSLTIDNGWGKESIDGHEVSWRVGFYEDTIKEEYLRGISVFSHGKVSQKPFFFDLSGGISAQNALEYMTGQVKMDFIDEGNINLISTERQRINLQTEIGKKIKKWGINKIKTLAQIWRKRRSEKRIQELENKVSGFKDRLDLLPPHERKTVKSVLTKIASFDRLGKGRFKDWCNDVLTSWETGRLKELINDISQIENLDENKFLEILSEADVLTALNIAEAIKTKIVTIGELKELVSKKVLENKIRDFIYAKPWLIHPKWEQFKKERSLDKIVVDLGKKHLSEEIFNGRVDLTLSAGSSLLVLEFMRPGVELDTDHLDRLNYYVMEIKNAIEQETGHTIRRLEKAYIIADSYKTTRLISDRIKQLEREDILFITWNTLIEDALKQWIDFLSLIKSRNPSDKRIQAL